MAETNILKVYVDNKGNITTSENTAFLINGSTQTNAVYLYIPTSWVSEVGINYVNAAFERKDGLRLLYRVMTYFGTSDDYTIYSYTIQDSDRILEVAGQLQISFTIKNTTNGKTYATPIVYGYVRRSLQPDAVVENTILEEAEQILEDAQTASQEYLEGHSIIVVDTTPENPVVGRTYLIKDSGQIKRFVGGLVEYNWTTICNWDVVNGLALSKEDKGNKKTTITNNNTDYPTTKAVKNALDQKQDTLTFDNTPTEDSTNPVTSGGVYDALQEGVMGIVVDEVTDGQMKPVTSNAVYDALNGKEVVSNKKTTITDSNTDYPTTKAVKTALAGKADLENGKIPSSQLPGYVDDVVEGYYRDGKFYEDARETIEIHGESGKVYLDKNGNKTYRWGVNQFIVIGTDLALGETSSTAYAGNKGKANADAIADILNGTTIDSFGDVENVLANIHSQVEITNTTTTGTIDIEADQTNMLNVRNVVKRGFTYFRYHHKTTSPDKIYYVSVNKDGEEEVIEYVVSTHAWTYSEVGLGGTPAITIDITQFVSQNEVLLTNEQAELLLDTTLGCYYATIPTGVEDSISGFLYAQVEYNDLRFYTMDLVTASGSAIFVFSLDPDTNIVTFNSFGLQRIQSVSINNNDQLEISVHDGDLGGVFYTTTDKVLSATKTQTFTAEEKAQLWSNLGLEDLDSEDF